ncbi:MAG: M42 family metallopeptidase [Firmicutes bacterium]|jgi:endoglucanase|nr:M42 family metallopeptidase [Bacillota bacterium]MDH7496765.1 M42 family metallopeptidase [Bacillota bacterium]
MLLKALAEAFGVSGQEHEVRGVLRDYVRPHCDEVETDSIGNLIAIKRGASKDAPKVMLAAHMDEIGLMITYIEKSGVLRFYPVGGVDPRVLVSKQVLVGKDRVPGVIGAKPIHLQKHDEAEKPFELEGMYIDIGAKDKDEAEKLVKLGDGVIFATQYAEIGSGRAKAKAFDDRAGCAVIAELLARDRRWNFTLQAVFTVQEEVGARGAQVAAYALQPDLAVALEGTTASDVPGSKKHLYSTSLGKGPALTHTDASLIADMRIVRRLMEVAGARGIPFQMRELAVGGTDAGRIHLIREGIPAAVVSVPTRYIHSPVSIIDKQDYEHTLALVGAFLDSIDERGLPC